MGQKGYKVLDLTTYKIKISRDVDFHESHFPFHNKVSSIPSTNLFYLPSITSFTTLEYQDIPDIFTFPFHSTSSTENDIIDISSTSETSYLQTNISSEPSSPSLNTPTITSSHQQVHEQQIPPLRRTSRLSKPSAYLADYKCNTVTKHWCNLVSFAQLHNQHHAYLTTSSIISEPTTYSQAATDPLWNEAMNKELSALQENQTWEVVSLPANKKPIGCKWVYKVKYKADGTIERYKARLVAKGYTQKYGIDFKETFSPVVKMPTIRAVLALAASHQWPIYQLDVNNAFLHGDLHEEVYMNMPPGIPNPHHKVCKLKKSLYGLKQASRQWYAKLLAELLLQGFQQSKADHSLFIKKSGINIIIATVYVDDILLTGTDALGINDLKKHLDTIFSIKDLGKLSYFIGMEVTYTNQGIILSQKKFTKELLQNCGFDLHTVAATPFPINLKLHSEEGPLCTDAEHYRSIIGKLNFLTNTRPDLSYAVQILSQFMPAPRQPHLQALHHVLRYIHGTVGQGILLNGHNELKLQAFSDADWASCPYSRKSITGYLVLLGGSPISWKSKKQSTVSRSSSESEYRAMASAASEIIWVLRLLSELGVHHLQPVTLHCDSQSAIHIAKNPVFHERTKHIEVDCHFTRDKVLEGLIQLTCLPTKSQVADLFTKALPSPYFKELLAKLGMISNTHS